MNKRFTIKTTLILFFIIICRLSLQAQVTPSQADTTKKILVVRPGQTDTQPANNPASKANTPPVKSNPVNTTPANTAPVKSNKPYIAPTTAERTGYPAYMHSETKPKTQPVITTPATPINNNTKAVVPAKTLTTPVVTTIPVKKDTIYITKTKKDTVYITKTKKDTVYLTKTKSSSTEEKARHSYSSKIIFGEIGGPGLAISANYDARFSGQQEGLGFRVGAGYYGNGGNTVFTVPIQLNYLIGKGSNHIELGGGTTFLNSTGDNKGKTFIFDRVTGFIGTATIGYRYQSETSGVNFRLGFVPIFYDYGIIYAGGVSIGYTFRSL